jgi:hypothetical protein
MPTLFDRLCNFYMRAWPHLGGPALLALLLTVLFIIAVCSALMKRLPRCPAGRALADVRTHWKPGRSWATGVSLGCGAGTTAGRGRRKW